jgi:protein involved in sex pheromone biosynthesis
MKKSLIWIVCALLFLTSCAPNIGRDEVVQDDESEEETAVIPAYQLSEANYRIILPYKPSQARGIIVDQTPNRLDISEMEEGLMRQSMEVYDPEDYFFQEGQYLDSDTVYEWLGRQKTEDVIESELEAELERREREGWTVNEEVEAAVREEINLGLNPIIEDDESEEAHRNSPRYLAHILEQNYLVQSDDDSIQLAGISIGLGLRSVYSFQTETGGSTYYEDIPYDEMVEEGQKMAQEVVERLRGMEELGNIPIMVALYRQEEEAAPVPGNYVAKTYVEGGETEINDWESVNEEYVLFPSEEGEEKYLDDHEIVTNFGNEVRKFFPNYVGIVGEGFYIDEQLQQLKIEIPIEFFGEGEVIGFSQYIYGLVQEIFPNYYDLEIQVTSNNELQSLIFRGAGEDEPTVRIIN